MLNTWDFISKLLPISQYLKDYNLNNALCDLLAGITVGLTLIPQVIAYASLAGLEPQIGLYSALCGGFIYAIFGTIPELNIAPTALLSLLTFQYVHNVTFGNTRAAIMLTFFAGVVELICGILHLGFLVDFVSTPVVSAFTSAGAITIASSQIKSLFGLNYKAESFINVWKQFFLHITGIQLWDTLLGLSCILILLLLRMVSKYGEAPTKNNRMSNKPSKSKQCIWYASVGRNAMVVVFSALMAFVFKFHKQTPFTLTSKVPSGFPNFSVPLQPIEANNGTNGTTISQMVAQLGYGIGVIPFVAILANVGIAKSFANGKVVDASQEMIAVGLSNIAGSFFGSFPVNASFSRAAVSSASGVRTPLSGIYTGIMVIMAFTFLTPYFSYIPKPALAAVIICAVVVMVDISITKSIWEGNRLDIVPFLVTFVACLISSIEVGILVGIFVEVCKLMYFTARPKVIIKQINVGQSYLRVTFTSSVFFSSAEHSREKILNYCLDEGRNIHIILLDCNRIFELDYTAGKCFESLVNELQTRQKYVAFLVSRSKTVKTLERCCTLKIDVFRNELEFITATQGEPATISICLLFRIHPGQRRRIHQIPFRRSLAHPQAQPKMQ
ncbi:sodium-independent sulfate anion transporter isoform X1 [Dendroctonus ponderosae]|uniref:sodium-independent sulfate anion transporter isoform X1 n=1 Tax=Dendroctonus ponderosae TaxID=77166 RepID=UPI00203571AB|nr:sodium-independent sulfate anion transporter isoform X1 [Dendroctonus ponderosae]